MLIVTLLFGFTVVSNAEVRWFNAYEVAIKYNGEWTDWEDCNVDVKLDISNDLVVIYSAETQVYSILYEIEAPRDSSGEQIAFRAKDQDGDYCTFRLRIQNNGTKQLYVDFADVSWVYNVR